MVIRVGTTRADVLTALRAVDTWTLKAVAAENGFSLRALWRYRAGTYEIPEPKIRPLWKALGLR